VLAPGAADERGTSAGPGVSAPSTEGPPPVGSAAEPAPRNPRFPLAAIREAVELLLADDKLLADVSAVRGHLQIIRAVAEDLAEILAGPAPGGLAHLPSGETEQAGSPPPEARVDPDLRGLRDRAALADAQALAAVR